MLRRSGAVHAKQGGLLLRLSQIWNGDSTTSAPSSFASAGTPTTVSPVSTGFSDAFLHLEAAMLRRQSCKQYDPTQSVDPALLSRILDATVRSPTAFNLQGWTAVIVVNDVQFQAEVKHSKTVAKAGAATTSVSLISSRQPAAVDPSQTSEIFTVLKETGASNVFLDALLDEHAQRQSTHKPTPSSKSTASSSTHSSGIDEHEVLRARLRDVHEKVKLAALGQPPVSQAPITIVFAGDMEPVQNAPAALEAGIENGYFNETFGSRYLRHVYYMLHGGPANALGVAKNTISGWYSYHTGAALLTVPSSKQAYAWKQTMIPATNFVTLCNAAGLSTLTLEGIDEGAMMAAVGLDAGRYTVPCIVTIGYPAKDLTANKSGSSGDVISPKAFHPTKSPRFPRDHFVHLGVYKGQH